MVLKLTEHDLQVHVFDVLRLNESLDPRLKWIYAVPNGWARSWTVAKKLVLEGVRAGISDICLPFPGTVNGADFYGAYIEMKAGSNKLTKEQIEFQDFVAQQHYSTQQFWHYDPALDFIEEYCNITFRGRERKPRKI